MGRKRKQLILFGLILLEALSLTACAVQQEEAVSGTLPWIERTESPKADTLPQGNWAWRETEQVAPSTTVKATTVRTTTAKATTVRATTMKETTEQATTAETTTEPATTVEATTAPATTAEVVAVPTTTAEVVAVVSSTLAAPDTEQAYTTETETETESPRIEESTTMAEARRIWEEFGIPSFLYEDSAATPARKNLADCRLVAPVSGIVGRRNISAGETAMPSQAVVTLLDITSVKVRFSVPEAEMAAITPQSPTSIQVEAIGREFQGGRIEKGVQADALTHTYDVRVRVDNKERALLPGMVAKVQVKRGEASSLGKHGIAQPLLSQGGGEVSVPLTSVQRRPDGSLFVWTVAADNTAHRTSVTIGDSRGNRVEVLTGIAEGTRVVTEGYQKLSEGTAVIY